MQVHTYKALLGTRCAASVLALPHKLPNALPQKLPLRYHQGPHDTVRAAVCPCPASDLFIHQDRGDGLLRCSLLLNAPRGRGGGGGSGNSGSGAAKCMQ